MRTTPALAGLLAMLALPATAVHAEVMGTIPLPPGYVHGYLPDEGTICGQVFTWKVNLSAGKDYALRSLFDRDGTATLRGPSGSVLFSFPVIISDELNNSTGHEIHATATGTYFLDVKIGPPPSWDPSCHGYDDDYELALLYDCLGGRRTQCTLPVGATRESDIAFGGEWDWWKTTLKAGKRYDIASSTCSGRIVLRDAKGKPVATSKDSLCDQSPWTAPAIRGFRPRVSGTYYVDVEGIPCRDACWDYGGYTVSLKAQ
jgi:hypothetical protein